MSSLSLGKSYLPSTFKSPSLTVTGTLVVYSSVVVLFKYTTLSVDSCSKSITSTSVGTPSISIVSLGVLDITKGSSIDISVGSTSVILSRRESTSTATASVTTPASVVSKLRDKTPAPLLEKEPIKTLPSTSSTKDVPKASITSFNPSPITAS